MAETEIPAMTAEDFDRLRASSRFNNALFPRHMAHGNYATMCLLDSLHDLHPEMSKALYDRLERARR